MVVGACRLRCVSGPATHQLDVLALKRDHLRRRVSASRRVDGFARLDQPAVLLEPLALGSYLIEFDAAHRMLQRARFQRAAIDDRLALGVFVDTMRTARSAFIRPKLELPVRAMATWRSMLIPYSCARERHSALRLSSSR